MPRVLFVLGITAFGGAENQCRYLLDALRGQGLDLELVCFRRGAAHERFEALGIPVHIVRARMPVTIDWYRRARGLRRVAGGRGPDILHTWLYEAHPVGLVASRCWPTTRVLLSHRSSGVLPRDRKFIAALRLLQRRIDQVVANSDAGAVTIISRVGIDANRVSVVPNGMPRERVAVQRGREAIRDQLGIAAGTPVVCSVGRIDREDAKDYQTLFAAMRHVWSALPEAELIVVGPTARQLERRLGVPLPSRVHPVGWQPKPSEWMNAANIVVIHSPAEGHSNVADEALMLGLPVATTDTGGHAVLVRRAGGRVVPVKRGDLLGEAILDLIRQPPNRNEVIEVAKSALSMENVASAYLYLYERLLVRSPTDTG
jgi:glycosyltransferase involved in cell wall biosynthesis